MQGLLGKGRFLATKRAQKRVCIVYLASAAILPFLVTSPDIQFWLSFEDKDLGDEDHRPENEDEQRLDMLTKERTGEGQATPDINH